MKSQEEIKSFYDEAVYRKLHGFIYTNDRVEYALQTLNDVFNYTQPKRVLEIGCGMGEILFRLASRFPETSFTGFDISEQSIKIADKLFKSTNVEFVRADSITESLLAPDDIFDVIYFMDVYEHIPIHYRKQLHSFIKEHISSKGFIFFSCPTPQHLDFLKRNDPAEIQPVDENISLQELNEVSGDTGLKLILYKHISVWRAGDYFHAIFSNFLEMQALSDFRINYHKKIELKKEVKKRIKEKLHLQKMPNPLDVKRNMIKDALGEETLMKVEAYKR